MCCMDRASFHKNNTLSTSQYHLQSCFGFDRVCNCVAMMDHTSLSVSSAFLLVLVALIGVNGHGRLMEPPSRSSLWRFGYQVPKNYDDNMLNCGGRDRQWTTNNGQCGLCGDPFDGNRENEAGGRYATGLIGRTYNAGQLIDIQVQITSAHGGWFEFRLCANNDPKRAITQQCLDQHLLQETTGSTRFQGVPTGGIEGATTLTLRYTLPTNLSCAQCVLQWKYHTGKDWGCDVINGAGTCGLGYGPQEEFYGCSDIAIRETSIQPGTTTTKSTTLPSTARQTSPTVTTKSTASAQSTAFKLTDTPTESATSAPVKTSPASSNATRITTTTAKPSSSPGASVKITGATTTATTISAPLPKTQTTLASGEKSPSQPDISTRPVSAKDILSCQGRGSLEGTLMDEKCRSMCRIGNCLLAFCNDACQRLF